MKGPKKSLRVTMPGVPPFEGKVAWKVFLAVLRHIGIDTVQRQYVWSIQADRPEREEFYEFIDGWWVRKHSSVDTMVGALTRLKAALGLNMEIAAWDVRQELRR